MSAGDLVGLVLAAVLGGYLLAALLLPDRF